MNLKLLICKLFKHYWQPHKQRHGHYYKIVCARCGTPYRKGE